MLRRFVPVLRLGSQRCWLISGTADIEHVLSDAETFSSSIMAPADACLLGADPPAHTRARRALGRALSPTRLREAEEVARTVALEIANRLESRDEFDLVAELAAPLPVAVMTALLGIEPARRGDLARWSQAVVADAAGQDGTGKENRQRLIAEFDGFLDGFLAEQRSVSGFANRLSLGSRDESLSPAEVRSVMRLLVIAGNETTTRLIANAALALLHDPEAWAAQAQRGDARCLVEEALRFDPPVQYLVRRTNKEVELSGTRLPAGAVVMVALGATGRDPDRCPRGDRFDPDRQPTGHFAFGLGPHACPGASLARMEARVGLEVLFRVLPRARLVKPKGEVSMGASLQMRGPSSLLIRRC